MEKRNYVILVVDDEPEILELLSLTLKSDEYNIHTVSTGQEAINFCKTVSPDIIILDIVMPDMDGIDTCKKLRKNPKLKASHIMMLTGKDDDHTQIRAFEAGADDYVIKPIKPLVFISRVKSKLKYKVPMVSKTRNITSTSNIMMDKINLKVYYNETPYQLTEQEFEILHFLVSNPNKVMSRERIKNFIWGKNRIVTPRTIDVHVRRIRMKIPELTNITAIRKAGYRYDI